MIIGQPCQYRDVSGDLHAAICTGVNKSNSNLINLTWRDVDNATWIDETDVPPATAINPDLRAWVLI